jgi:hypothetical protein
VQQELGSYIAGTVVTSTAQTTYAANTEFSKAHGQGSIPDLIYAYGLVQSGHSDLGYSFGNKVMMTTGGNVTTGHGLQVYADSSHMYGAIGAGQIQIMDRSFPHDMGIIATGEWDIHLVGLWF